MNCGQIRQRLLESEQPDQPGREESGHLAECASCRAWLKRLVRLEQQITELQVPSSPVPVSFLEQLRQAPVGALVRAPVPPSADARRIREGGRQKLAVASALAATLTLFTLAWWAWPPRGAIEPPSMSSPYPRVVEERLRYATTPRERLEALTDLAEDLLTEVRVYRNDPAQVALLASHFERLVQSDLFESARDLAMSERAQVLSPIVVRLGRAESTASRVAAQWDGRHAESARSLRQMAASAREAERRLRLLVHSGRS